MSMDEAGYKQRIAALEREVNILKRGVERCEQSRKLLEDTKDRYDLIYRSAMKKLDEQKEVLDQRNAELQSVHQELLEKNQELEKAATTDALTELYNRRMIGELLAQEVYRTKRYGHPFAVILLDVDHFKAVNDAHGHNVGDQVLASTARLLQEAARSADAVGRWGGEEFLMLLPSTGAAEALVLGERLRLGMEEHDFGLPTPLTVSMGVAQYDPEESVDELVRRADIALYEAKRTRNACRAYPAPRGARTDAT